tara:strand:+ start:175 stop:966 length:792 start_codon:yes stop_codon:yes gene_type:complete
MLRKIKEINDYRDLLYFLVMRDINAVYKQTVMGFAWAIIRPLVQMVVFTLFFGNMAGIKGDMADSVPYALFSYIALVPWTYFATSLNGSSSSLVSNMGIMTKVYFPRLIIPLVPIFAKFIDFIIAFMVIFGLCLYYGIYPKLEIVYMPLLIINLVTFVFGLGLWFSSMAIQYRDVNQIMTFGIQVLMFAAPVIWPISYIPDSWQMLYALYPMVGIIEGFRACFIQGFEMPILLLLIGSCSSLFFLFTGMFYFQRKERFFADVA